MVTTLEQAKNLLTDLQPGDKIEIEITPTGEVIVNSTKNNIKNENSTKTKNDILGETYADLIGQSITVTEAAKKYDVNRRNILRWKDKGYITVLESGYQMKLNEAEVAYCADIHKKKKKSGIGFHAPLFDENGLPYQLKHPALARYRRENRQSNTS